MNMSETSEIPTHVGLILDGNRRWAKAQGLPSLEGHRAGYSNLKTITKHAINSGVKYVSAYIFSTENWNRSKEEVKYLMDLALWYAKHEVAEVHKEEIKVVFLGRKDGLSKKLLSAINDAEVLTRNNKRGTLALCFNYGGRQEIVDAVNIAMQDNPKQITLDSIEQNLYSFDIPSIDLIIRTSGEQRLSNFMLWRAAYAELLFVSKHWPDFGTPDFDEALGEYKKRQRRYGK